MRAAEMAERAAIISTTRNEKAAQVVARPSPISLVMGGNVWRSSPRWGKH